MNTRISNTDKYPDTGHQTWCDCYECHRYKKHQQLRPSNKQALTDAVQLPPPTTTFKTDLTWEELTSQRFALRQLPNYHSSHAKPATVMRVVADLDHTNYNLPL